MIIDTNLFIHHLRNKVSGNTPFSKLLRTEKLYISRITVFELLVGATDDIKKQVINTLIEGFEILEFDEKVMLVAVELAQYIRKNRLQSGRADLLIAATALAHNLPIVTLNKADFEIFPSIIHSIAIRINYQ